MDAFTRNTLRMMLSVKLSVSMDDITASGTFDEQLFDIIGWFQRADRVQELIAGAHLTIPSNKALEALCNSSEAWFFPTNANKLETVKQAIALLQKNRVVHMLAEY
jgi:hypothetical protein